MASTGGVGSNEGSPIIPPDDSEDEMASTGGVGSNEGSPIIPPDDSEDEMASTGGVGSNEGSPIIPPDDSEDEMASTGGAGSNEGSPIIRPDESEDDFEAGFDFQSLTTGPALSIPPLHGGITKLPEGDPLSEPQNRVSTSSGELPEIQLQNSYQSSIRNEEQTHIVSPTEKEKYKTPWNFSEAERIDLSDFEKTSIVVPIKKENFQASRKFSEAQRIDLLDSEKTSIVIPVKQEDSKGPWKFSEAEVIDLSEPEKNSIAISIKQEEPTALWRFSDTELIELSDSEHELPLLNPVPVDFSVHKDVENNDRGQGTNQDRNLPTSQDNSLEVDESLNQEPQNRSRDSSQVFLQATVHEHINMESPGKNASKMHRLQKILAERALGKPLAEGADQLFNKLKTSNLRTSGTGTEDSNIWMNATVDSDTDPGATFAAAEIDMKKKRRAKKVDLVDEIYYKKAQFAEEARLKRQELDHLASRETISRDDPDEGSDVDLFVSQEAENPRKRSHAMTMEDENGDSLEEMNGGSPTSKRAKSMSKKKHANDTEAELKASMLVGIENELANRKKARAPKKAIANNRRPRRKNLNAGKGKVTKRNSKRMNGAGKKSKAKKQTAFADDYADDIDNLLHSNVYEDANNNQGLRELPSITHKDKQKALTALLASVPLEERGSTRGEKSQILKSIKALGSRRVGADGAGKWRMKGMISSLHHHQVQGAAWMRERETGTVHPLGGLQADQMGFGKTVMMIATILANPPGPHDSKCTLIVCTPAILTQWMNEISLHIESGVLPQVFRYKASTCWTTFGKNCEPVLSNANIILTTYQEVVRSYPRHKFPKGLTTAEQKENWWKGVYERKRGILHKIYFFRVVLDEAQAIKNHKSFTSTACRALMAKHRWALSGTPIFNTLDELYPYFKFLRVKHTGNFDVFKENFCNSNNEDSMPRLHSFLKQFMLRRTHKNRLFGASIVPMPWNTQVTCTIEFNSVERAIYDAFKNNAIETINRDSRAGTLEKSYSNVLTMLLRLRQLTAHPFMIRGIIEKNFDLEAVQKMADLCSTEVNADQKPARDMLSTMEKMIRAHKDPVEIAQDTNIELLDPNSQEGEDANESSPLVSKFRDSLRELANSSKWAELTDRSLCHRCKDQPDDPWVTDCAHLYCRECLGFLAFEASEKGESQSTCLECSHTFIETHPCKGIEEFGLRKDSTTATATASKQKQRNLDDDIKWINLEGKLLPSSKISAVQAQIERWLEEDPEKKIIIFSQFYTVMKILEKMCQQKKWDYCKYDGSMNIAARDKAIDQFGSNPALKILIASLKCGGVGLNLTMASRVICVDLWWNDAVEQQAFCRVFRIGQNSETFVTRFVVKDTVDEKLQKMQMVKGKRIEAAIDDPKMLEKLSLQELLRLFGPVSLDAHRRPFILVVDDDEVKARLPRRRYDTERAYSSFANAITESEDFQ